MSAEVAVVVPTRDRPVALARCLAALADQAGADHEIVVVDDASRDRDAVATVVTAAPRARLVRGAGRGPAAARNLGAAATGAPHLCFTDDDCRPGPAWLARMHDRLEAGDAVVAGPTLVANPHNAYAVASQTITDAVVRSGLDRRSGTVAFAPTSNLACSADVLATVPFDEDYPLAAGEDREWCARLGDRGIAIAWEPGAWVDHTQDLDAGRFWDQQVRYGRGARRFHADRATRVLTPRPLHAAVVRAGFRRGVRVGTLVLVAQVATALGAARAQRGSSNGTPGRSG